MIEFTETKTIFAKPIPYRIVKFGPEPKRFKEFVPPSKRRRPYHGWMGTTE